MKKVVKPAPRRHLVGHFQAEHAMSQRRACRLAGLSRKAAAYRAVSCSDRRLRERLRALGEPYPRYGYLLLYAMLRAEGLVKNRERTYRLYTALAMQVRTKRRKKLLRPRIPLVVPRQANERWSLDFVHDQRGDGRRIRILCIVDAYARVCVGQLVDTSISGERMSRFLDQLQRERGLPKTIVLDNGPEMTSKAMAFLQPAPGREASLYPAG